MTADEQTTGPVWRDRGTIIANQQARIAELEAACQRLRDDYQGALAERDEARAGVETWMGRAANEHSRCATTIINRDLETARERERAEAAEADAAGLRARMLRLADEWDMSHYVTVADMTLDQFCDHWFRKPLRAALAAEPTPAAEPHAEDGPCPTCGKAITRHANGRIRRHKVPDDYVGVVAGGDRGICVESIKGHSFAKDHLKGDHR